MVLRALPALVAAALLTAAPAVRAAGVKPFPFPTEVVTLPNGLRVALVPFGSPGLAAYYTLVRVGSRNEAEAGRSGYAHFFEHMMFRGTKLHSGEEYNATVTRLGLDTNAFTSEDMTVYHLYGPSKALPTIIEYEADRFQHLDYDEAQFKTEAGAILGEYAKSASRPELKLREKMLETAFDAHTYRHTVIGFLDDVKAMPSGFAYSREFFRRYYTPDNCLIVVAGDFDKAQVLSLIEKAYGGWQGKVDPAAIQAEPPQKKARRAQVDWPSPTLPRLWLAWHSPAASDLGAAAAQNVLNDYLFGPTSPLYQDLVLGPAAGGRHLPHLERAPRPLPVRRAAAREEGGRSAGGREGGAGRAEGAGRRQGGPQAAGRGAQQPHLQRRAPARQRQHRGRHPGRHHRPDRRPRVPQPALRPRRQAGPRRALDLRQEVAHRRQPNHRHADRSEGRRQVNRAVKLAAAAVLAALAQVAAAQAAAPAPAAPRVLALPPSDKAGVYLMLRFRTGAVDDPAGRAGLTALTARLMAEGGTAALDARRLREALFPIAADLDVRVDDEQTTFMARVHRDAVDKLVPILVDVVTHPRWDAEGVHPHPPADRGTTSRSACARPTTRSWARRR